MTQKELNVYLDAQCREIEEIVASTFDFVVRRNKLKTMLTDMLFRAVKDGVAVRESGE